MIEERVARLEANVEHVKSGVSAIKADMRRLEDKVDALKIGLNDRIDAIYAKLTARIDAVNQKVDA